MHLHLPRYQSHNWSCNKVCSRGLDKRGLDLSLCAGATGTVDWWAALHCTQDFRWHWLKTLFLHLASQGFTCFSYFCDCLKWVVLFVQLFTVKLNWNKKGVKCYSLPPCVVGIDRLWDVFKDMHVPDTRLSFINEVSWKW